jgi:Glycosyl transferase family 2
MAPRDPHPNDPLEVSVVIPCLDEEKTIGICVAKGVAALRDHGLRGEVIVSDNGSTDRSIQVASDAGARIVRCPVRGYGAALQYGFENARGRYLIMGDADDSYDFGLLPRFVEKLREGHRFVMGSRLRGTIDRGAMPVLNRYLGTPVLSAVLNGLFGTSISDCNCGMRGIERSALLSIGATSPGMEYASEMIVKAAIHGIPIVEVPIDFHRDQRDRPPHLRPWRDGWRHLRLLLWHAPDQTMTFPGLALLLLGALLVFSGVGGPFHLGPYLFDIHFMVLGLTLAMLGLPALSMGIAVHALIPERKLRKARLLGSVKTWFTFDRGMVVAGLFFLPGLACDLAVLIHWLTIHRGPLTPTHTRLALAGALLVAMGFQSAFLALLVGSARSAFAPQIFPPDERQPDPSPASADLLSPAPPAVRAPGAPSAP